MMCQDGKWSGPPVRVGTPTSRRKTAVTETLTRRARLYDRCTSDSRLSGLRWATGSNGSLVAVSPSRASGDDGPQSLHRSRAEGATGAPKRRQGPGLPPVLRTLR